ncbi:MAG: histidine kinase [Thermodesulfobacteriota bacterium]|nr:MAG: histidine kinase [Thermodesulfobacteriota bacterium]
MKVSEIMTQPVLTITQDRSLEEVAHIMLNSKVGGLPVVDNEGKIVGMVTESDFSAKEHAIPFSRNYAPQLFGEWMSKEGIDKAYEAARNIQVQEVMSKPAITIGEDDTVAEAVRRMLEQKVHRLPVVRDEVPVGILSRHDLLKMVVQKFEGFKEE